MNPRVTVEIETDANESHKHVEAGGAACWYWVCCLMYCRRNEAKRRQKGLPPGFIPEAVVLTLYPDPKARGHVKKLVAVKLLHKVEGGYEIHEYEKQYGLTSQPHQPAGTPTPSQLGGKARAAGAKRGPGGTFQRSSQLDLVTQPTRAIPDSNTQNPKASEDTAEGLSGRADQPGDQPEQQQPQQQFKVPCPSDLKLTDDQRSTLITAMIPAHAIDSLTTRFVAKAVGDPDEKRTLVHWRKSLAAAITGDWNGGRRPQDPATAGQPRAPYAGRRAGPLQVDDPSITGTENAEFIDASGGDDARA